ncbi:MAG: toxin-activating lysine-acyltransferase [Rhodobacteraceae bacterium]|nr:toxin-activating lysine-acyltransferase [Paracoccaceae bacterium]
MGQVCWLMTLSKDHRDKPISLIEAHVSAPLMLKQVRVFTKGKQPLAAVLWAYVSPEVKAKLDTGTHVMSLQDWRSGPEVVVVDCISPLVDGQMFVKEFMAQVQSAQAKQK